MGYCEKQDVYRFVPAGILAVPGRLVSSASASTELLTLDGHGLVLNQTISFRAEAGGSLPSPLVAGTTYYAKPVSDSTFQVAATSGGTAINLTTTGSNIVLIADLPWADWIAECSAMIDQTLVAHVVPITGPIPEPVRVYCSALLAFRALSHVGASTGSVQSSIEFWAKQAKEWARGVPLRGANVPVAGNLASSFSGVAGDPRGWTRGSSRIP